MIFLLMYLLHSSDKTAEMHRRHFALENLYDLLTGLAESLSSGNDPNFLTQSGANIF